MPPGMVFQLGRSKKFLARQPYLDPYEGAEDEEESQFRAYGTTVALSDRNGQFRPISAWPMSEKEFETYADQIHHPRQTSEDPEV